MRILFSMILACTPFACDPAEAEGWEAEAEAEAEDLQADHEEAEAWDEAVGGLSQRDTSAWQCHCWTTCSSNGKGWTKSYFVGSYGTKATCNKKAKAYCKDKSPSYTYPPNAGCGERP